MTFHLFSSFRVVDVGGAMHNATFKLLPRPAFGDTEVLLSG